MDKPRERGGKLIFIELLWWLETMMHDLYLVI